MILIPDRHKEAVFTTTAVCLNLAVTLYCQQLTFGAWDVFLGRWGMIGSHLARHPETLLTAQFIHIGFTHCLANLLFLWAFGLLAEAALGAYLTLTVYLVGGTMGYLAYAAVNLQTSIPLVGASSAIAALMGVVCILEPHHKLRLWFILLEPLEVPAWVFLGLWVFLQVSNVTTPISTVAYISHAVGFGVGTCVALVHTHLKHP